MCIQLGSGSVWAELIRPRGSFSLLSSSFVQVHLRAEDGRGPLWWAHEYEKWDIIDLLKERGADFDAVDVNEQKPADLLPAGAQRDEL